MVKVPMNIDPSGRMMSMRGSMVHGDSKNYVEEIQIQVQNNDKGGSISIWTMQQFDDRLDMMRDALAKSEIKDADETKSNERLTVV